MPEAMDIIREELEGMGIPWDSASILRDRDGVLVARVGGGGASRVLKCFQKGEHRREIENYRLLTALGIPTIQVIASTESALLLEDIDRSAACRLGTEEDMSDPETARRIAAWYRLLHSRGREYVSRHGAGMYDEGDFFTPENIARIRERTGTRGAPGWALLEGNFSAVRDLLRAAPRTLCYHDFYHTNLAVARDGSSALMFDYDLLGRGYAYTDVRNVLSSLSEEAGRAFLDAYGPFDPMERALDDVVGVVVSLHLACRREVFPVWGEALLDEIHTAFGGKVEYLLDAYGGRCAHRAD